MSHFTLREQVTYDMRNFQKQKMEETVHGSYSWCRLTKRETY
jgi:hypothetical protein